MRSSTSVLAVLCALLAAGFWVSPGHAQREPVLPQIKEPHSYYYRELYLPQLTSGPSGATWSPDGSELIYSMQGTLWRQRVDGTEARQLTDGPDYAYQPDWSPDGRTIVFAAYTGRAVDLRLLDLASGATTALVANGAVNVEPRWSPDAKRIAFVSTAYQGRFHVFLATPEAMTASDTGGALQVVRITEDRDSQLPRYYYSVFDQYLSPTWSPDGKELILISNRGHVWGSGTLWRMAADSAGAMRELRVEETNWGARPDWARDGRRVVYASYQGRQWHQLWLMTDSGDNPFQLTYGDFDATYPRWSPDGRRVAFISNQTGNTSLWVVDVPGGGRREVRATTRHYLHDIGHLQLVVVDSATGRQVPARVSVTGADGRSFAPDDARRHADDYVERPEHRFEYGYFHTPGRSTIAVPVGDVTVEVTRGPEYRMSRRLVHVTANATATMRVRLSRLTDLAARGWWSGDLHVHMNYGGHYRNTPVGLRGMAEAEDLHVVENLIVNKEGRIPDLAYFTGKPDPATTPRTLILHDQEYHTSLWGHTGLLGLRDHVILPAYAAYTGTAAASPFFTNADVMREARLEGAVTGYVHPGDVLADTTQPDRTAAYTIPVDVALGLVDYMELVSFSEHVSTAFVWYRLLNCGFRIPAAAGTDAMTNYASLRGPVGLNRVYVKLDGPLTRDRYLAGLKAGRTFATNGPLVELTVNGRGPGEEIRLPARGGSLALRATLRSYVPVERFELVANGEVVARFNPGQDSTSATVDTTITVTRSGWYTLKAWSTRPRHPVLDIYPFATTSPIYVTVGGEPIRSPRDAAYFVRWIDRLDSLARANTGWNSDAEKEATLRKFAEARRVYAAQAAAP
ncbi:MAG TPA: CehA/McbA family metallohydrolase [Gemmatimonadales bacterium]|nr:CehA/McbA family metallohydrolase [Gemmatimonadales bacterium]